MKICVTGANGFIGHQLANKLIAENYEVLPIDTGLIFDHNIILENNDFSFLDDVDFCFHLGANSSTRATAIELFPTNIQFTVKLFEECLKRKIFVVFSSSGAIYDSERKESPMTAYGCSKLMGEKFSGDNVVCLRYHNVYGSTEKHKGDMASLVFKWIDGQDKNLFEGSDKILRDFVHVDDINKINIMFLEYWKQNKKMPPNKIYDVGTGCAVSFQEVADEIVKHTHTTYKYIPNPYDRSNYQFYTQADTTKIKLLHLSVYGTEFSPIDIETGVKKVFKNYSNGNRN